MQRIVAISAGEPLTIVVERDGRAVTLKATPQLKDVKDAFGNMQRIGVLGISRSMAPGDVRTKQLGPIEAVSQGAQETWFVIDRTLSYIGGVFAGREKANQLGGPIRIAQVSGEVASAGFAALLHLTAVLSISIGLLNLFPIPLLDGGHLLFYGIEAVRGRPISERAQEVGFRIGLAIVVMLMIFATFNDILHLTTS
jgi:regulator of sigma E protease